MDASGNGSTEKSCPTLGVEFGPGMAVYPSCKGLLFYLNEEYATEMAINRDQELVSGQKVVVNSSVASTLTVM